MSSGSRSPMPSVVRRGALTEARCHVPFTDIGAAVMKGLADTQGIKIDHGDKKELTEKFSTIPPHPEVQAALRRLLADVGTNRLIPEGSADNASEYASE